MDPRPLLLQLRLRGKIVDPGGPESADTAAAGHAVVRGAHLVLTPDGRAQADREFALDSDARDDAAAAYEHFRPRNTQLIRVCHDWQVRAGGHANDHRDAKYDWDVIDRLGVVDDRIGPVIRRLGRAQPDFADYRPRLRDARGRVEAGDHEWFTSPRIDSYHTVWMELHEHFLVGLAIERASESADTP
ncbi:MAG: MarR family transcriptional regulator [Acidimicrobiia bacterium]|nr:MarR family transcriptional regulator [Acidimicrobiia bacterium]